jgi:peptidoglycan hydrolase-like protein with peptidoglycan-binding domain
MQIGDKGKDVKPVQRNLKTLGYYTARIDGDFGPKTRAAVLEFQRTHLVNGIVDGYVEAHIQGIADDRRAIARRLKIPHGMKEVERTFGVIQYETRPDGRITITNNWAKRNITKVDLPIVGPKWIHKKCVAVFTQALFTIRDNGLADEIKQFGTWSPRHKFHNPRKPLSLHSWGIACDINWATNPAGSQGDIDPGIVTAFEDVGFVWGGKFRTPDPMHLQLTTGA